MMVPKVVLRPVWGLLAAAALLPAGGCSLFEDKKPDQPQCPRISVLADTATETRFRPGPGRDLTDVELTAAIGNFSGDCLFDFDKRIMNIKVQVSLDARLGPAAHGRKADISYFIAIPAYYPAASAKKVLPVAIEFPKDSSSVRYTDGEVQLNLPIKDLRDLAAYEIFLGMQVTPEELEYNRSQKEER